MSVIQEIHTELSRLAMAGAARALGDLRLARLIPKAERLAERARVFSRVAEALKALAASGAPGDLGRAQALVFAVKSAQILAAPAGTMAQLQPSPPGRRSGRYSSQELRAFSAALASSGAGQLAHLQTRASRLSGQPPLAATFSDLRMIGPALAALDDRKLAAVAEEGLDGLAAQDPALLDALERSLSGQEGDVRRIGLIAQVDRARAERLGLQLLKERPPKEVQSRVRLYQLLSSSQDILQLLIEDAEALLSRGHIHVDALLVELAQRTEPEATAAIIRMFALGRPRGMGGTDWRWHEACPHFNEELQAVLRAAATDPSQGVGEWTQEQWAGLLVACGPSEENLKVVLEVYEASEDSSWDFYGIHEFVHEHASDEVIRRLLAQRQADVGSGARGLVEEAALRLPSDEFYELLSAEGWAQDEELCALLRDTSLEYSWDDRWLPEALALELPHVALSLAEPGHEAAEALFFKTPKYMPSERWPRPRAAPLEIELSQGPAIMDGGVGPGWANFLSRGRGELRFGLKIDHRIEEGSALGFSLRGDFSVEFYTVRVLREDGEEERLTRGPLEVDYPSWTSFRINRLPKGRLIGICFELPEEDAGRRGIVQLRGLNIKAKKSAAKSLGGCSRSFALQVKHECALRRG